MQHFPFPTTYSEKDSQSIQTASIRHYQNDAACAHLASSQSSMALIEVEESALPMTMANSAAPIVIHIEDLIEALLQGTVPSLATVEKENPLA